MRGRGQPNNLRRSIKLLKLHSTTRGNYQLNKSEILIYNILHCLATMKLEAMLSQIVDISCILDLSTLSSTGLPTTSESESGGIKSGSSSTILKAGS